MNALRCKWIDIAKGIAIILMVLGHSSLPTWASNFIFAFHMPLFFIASGLCMNWQKLSFGEFLKNKIKSLIVPFIVYSTIVLIISSINVGGYAKCLEIIRDGWQGYPLWFVPVLFFAILISKIIFNIKSRYCQIVITLLMLLIGTVLSYKHIALPWTLSTVPYATFLIILGSYFKTYKYFFDKPRFLILLCGIFITLVVSHYYRLDMAWNKITPVTILTIGALAGTATVFAISSYLEKYTKLISRCLQAIGKETYIVLAFASLIITLCNEHVSQNIIIKYSILVLSLFGLKYIKDGVYKLISKIENNV